jgi:hypothetical protein
MQTLNVNTLAYVLTMSVQKVCNVISVHKCEALLFINATPFLLWRDSISPSILCNLRPQQAETVPQDHAAWVGLIILLLQDMLFVICLLWIVTQKGGDRALVISKVYVSTESAFEYIHGHHTYVCTWPQRLSKLFNECR